MSSSIPSLETVGFAVADAVATLTIARPDSRNALTDQVCIDLIAALGAVEESQDISVVVLTGEGPVFCAGGDRNKPSRLQSDDPTERLRMARRWDTLFEGFDRLRQPTVGALRGAAIGGGAMLALACDLRVAESNLILRFPEVLMGQYLLASGTARVVSEVGPARARDLLLTGRTIDAATAERWGLVNRVVEGRELDETVDELCGVLRDIPAPVATLTRQSVRAASYSAIPGWADAHLGSAG